jgi:hypothetical protein
MVGVFILRCSKSPRAGFGTKQNLKYKGLKYEGDASIAGAVTARLCQSGVNALFVLLHRFNRTPTSTRFTAQPFGANCCNRFCETIAGGKFGHGRDAVANAVNKFDWYHTSPNSVSKDGHS